LQKSSKQPFNFFFLINRVIEIIFLGRMLIKLNFLGFLIPPVSKVLYFLDLFIATRNRFNIE